MHIKDTLVNFLYDKEYFISIYDNFIHVFNYKELIILKLDKFKLEIKGEDLFITKMMPNEILIRGVIKNVGINYE